MKRKINTDKITIYLAKRYEPINKGQTKQIQKRAPYTYSEKPVVDILYQQDMEKQRGA